MPELIKLRPYQETAINEIRTALAQYQRVLFQLPTGGGKCFGADTPILMFDGSIKKVQDVQVGDLLMGDDSCPRRVESTCVGTEMLYRITPNKGDSFVCNQSHILALRYSDAEHRFALRDIELTDYLKLSKTEKHILKQYRASVDFEERSTSIDPYLLGLWIADGSKTAAEPHITVCNDDIEIIEYLYSLGGRELSEQKGNCRLISLSGLTNPNGHRKNSNLYRDEFKKCLFGSHYDIGIPREYLINSREKRMALLAGILDGDGNTDPKKGGYDIITKFPRLCEDILFLARSLGFAAYASIKRVDISKLKFSKNTDIREYHRISISGFCETIPVKLPRKHSAPRKMNKNVLNVGFSVEEIGEGNYYGFEISGNNRRFLLGDFTVAHNTVCFAHIAASSQKYDRKVLILSSRTEILMQNGGALEKFGLVAQYVSPKNRKLPTENCVVAMAQTMKRRVEKPEWRDYLKTVEILIVDECHECVGAFIYPYMSENCFVLGVSATPRRFGKMPQLGEVFRAMVKGVTVRELVEMGYLAKARHFTVAAPKLNDVKIDSGTGDYNGKQLARKFEDKTIYKGVIDEWFRICPTAKTICFCVSSEQAIAFTQELNARGVKAKYVLSGNFESDESYSGERSEVFAEFHRNEIQVLVNVGVCIAGYDEPSIECVILNFATISMTKYRQAIGRASRICEGKKEFIILDAGENVRRLGLFEQDVDYSLWHDVGAGGGMMMLKDCDPTKPDRNGKYGCGARIPNTCRMCPNCGKLLIDKEYDYQCQLEEVVEQSEESIEVYAAKKRLEGWSIPRIMISVCVANHDNMRKAFCQAYMALNPNKDYKAACAYYYVFMKQFGDKIKKKREE